MNVPRLCLAVFAFALASLGCASRSDRICTAQMETVDRAQVSRSVFEPRKKEARVQTYCRAKDRS